MEFNKQQIEYMQDFIWNGFTNAESVGVNLEDVLTGARFVGVNLTDEQIKSVIDHYTEQDEWNNEDEKVRDLISEATDCEDGDKLFKWFEWIDGVYAYDIFYEF